MKTILLLIALLGVGSVALAVSVDVRSLQETILGALMLLSLVGVVVVFFFADRA